jgi:urease accessory protein
MLSAAIRLNKLGPYAAQQLLLHVVRDIVTSSLDRCKQLRTGMRVLDGEEGEEIPVGIDSAASTWPLGEIIAARHDLQHSRIFNS